ncbi:MAG: hypothetical protein SNJ83_03190, partial [Aggregatilineales bacterium]
MARLPRLTIGARMLQFAQRKLGTYASSGVTPVPPRVKLTGAHAALADTISRGVQVCRRAECAFHSV